MDDSGTWWTLVRGEGPIVAAAIHAGHAVRREVDECLALSEADRLREEDPFTDRWTVAASNRLVSHRSRYEVDLNRDRTGAVYLTPEDAWGMQVWRVPLSAEVIARSLGLYDSFYAAVGLMLRDLADRFGHFIVLDLHSYNHRRGRPDAEPADPALNPDVNVGTGTLRRQNSAGWTSGVVDRFVGALREYEYRGRKLDVRENVKFRGGYFSRWVNETFPGKGCALAVEVKKFFMNEWTGKADAADVEEVGRVVAFVVPLLEEELNRL